MTYLDRPVDVHSVGSVYQEEAISVERQPLVVIVEDEDSISEALRPICEFLDVAIERIPSEVDLNGVLRDFRPMAVVAELDGRGQDGCNVMITVANYDRSLPILLLTGADRHLVGAVDAVEEIWQLESVTKSPFAPSVGQCVDFIFRAGRKGRCTRLMPV